MQLLLFCFSLFFFQYHVYIFCFLFSFRKRPQKESHTLCSMNVCIFNLFVVCQNEDLKHDAGVVTSKREAEEEEVKIPRMISLCICAMVGAGEGAGCLLEGGVCRKLKQVAKSLKILKGVFLSRGVCSNSPPSGILPPPSPL